MHSKLNFIELGLSADTNSADRIKENHSYTLIRNVGAVECAAAQAQDKQNYLSRFVEYVVFPRYFNPNSCKFE